jgi:hypothetical protein
LPFLLPAGQKNTTGFVIQTGVGRISDGLFLYRGIEVDPLQVFLGDVLFALGGFDGDFEQFLQSFVADALSLLDQTGRIERELMLEVLETAEVLPVTILDELGNRGLVVD